MPPASAGRSPHDGVAHRQGSGMSPGFTFERVYHALKDRLKNGDFQPGDHLEPAVLGPDLNASITPVRDALHRLVGERMVEAPRNDGFGVPAPTEADLRDLYGWNRSLLDLALRTAPPRAPGLGITVAAPDSRGTPVTDSELFAAIAQRAGSAEHEAAVANLNDRLASLRIVEARLFEDAAGELRTMCTAWEEGDLAELRRCVAAYHRRRQRHVPEILIASRTFHRER